MTAALEGGEWSATLPGRTLPPGKTRYPFYRRLGEPQGRSGRGGKSRSHRDSIPDRPARSQSLYRLSYPAHLHAKYLLFLSDFNEIRIFLNRFSKNTQISNFMKIRPVRASFFHTDRRRIDMTKPVVAFRNFAKAPNYLLNHLHSFI